MVVYRRQLLKTISSEQSAATLVFEDNLGTVSTSRSNKITPRTERIDIKFHHVRSLIADKAVDAKYITIGFQRVDILTKSLGALKFISNRLMLLGEWTPPPPFSKSGISLKGLMELVCTKKVNGGGVALLKFHAVVDDICVLW